MEIAKLVESQHAYFKTGATRPVAARLAALRQLEQAIRLHEKEICNALCNDLGKSDFESYMCEIGLVLDEIRFQQKHLARFARPRRVKTPMAQFKATSFVSPEPYGVVLVMSPWNYPFMLTLDPVIGAIAAGNCVVIKPSAYSASTSDLLGQLFAGLFQQEFVAVVPGGRAENTALLEQKFDYIFFTGSVEVGKLVMEKASRNLTPVTLELGGKSPCIVDETANLKLAAKRIVFGKYLNVGQTCVAPDYLFVHESVKDHLVGYLKMAITECYGAKPLENRDYGRIVNQKHFERICGLMEGEKILAGGETQPEKLRIAPTILGDITPESPVMQEEIFGPILPVMTYRDLSEVADYVSAHPKPLAFYFFTTSRAHEEYLLSRCSFGGGCINDTIIHLATTAMPFGGVGASGMGSYHGKASFDTFTHYRSIVKKANWVDLPIRYQPYDEKKEKLLRMFLH